MNTKTLAAWMRLLADALKKRADQLDPPPPVQPNSAGGAGPVLPPR